MSVLDHPTVRGRMQTLRDEADSANSIANERQATIDSLRNDFSLLQKRFTDYSEQVKNVLFDMYRACDYDENTILAVMRNLSIDTRTTKKFEVTVSFDVEIECAFGEDVEKNAFEWDMNYEVTSMDHEIVNYEATVLYANEA